MSCGEAVLPMFPGGVRVRGVLMDVDGTLYDQRRLRLRMAMTLAALPLHGGLRSAWRTWSVIGRFRSMRERLRAHPGGDLESAQYDVPAHALGRSSDEVRRIVEEWMFERPLVHLAGFRMPGLVAFLDEMRKRGLVLGVLSDYPVEAKLEALGLAGYFGTMLCTSDPEIDRLKPDPAGFRRFCELTGLAPGEVLFVGDREDVDAGGAAAAGMPCAIVRRGSGKRPARENLLQNLLVVRSYAELTAKICPGTGGSPAATGCPLASP